MKVAFLATAAMTFTSVTIAAHCRNGLFYCGDELVNFDYAESDLRDKAAQGEGDGGGVMYKYLFKCYLGNTLSYKKYCPIDCKHGDEGKNSYCLLEPESAFVVQE